MGILLSKLSTNTLWTENYKPHNVQLQFHIVTVMAYQPSQQHTSNNAESRKIFASLLYSEKIFGNNISKYLKNDNQQHNHQKSYIQFQVQC